MININERDRKFIIDNLPDGEKILESGDADELLDVLYDVIDRKGFFGYDYNDFGREAQKVYDRIYDDN